MNHHINSQKCLSCPSNAECLGGNYVIPISGYWRFSNTSLKIIKCVSDSCLGFPNNLDMNQIIENYTFYENFNDLIHGSCQIGNSGHLCFICEFQYGKSSKNDICSLCASNQSKDYIKLVLISLGIFFYLTFTVKFMKNSKSHVNSLILKIFLNHIQKYNS